MEYICAEFSQYTLAIDGFRGCGGQESQEAQLGQTQKYVEENTHRLDLLDGCFEQMLSLSSFSAYPEHNMAPPEHFSGDASK
ncbi:hypothetical protein EXN66_Car022121 [Channa argus]|uniref:Uncharacterized protein n=1 Tax=Channa argus TaxID=215402 RepID=A0A6G1QVT2_CHAAH|nr:hypothetical protein EXN66_Car022121 [Channa argus]